MQKYASKRGIKDFGVFLLVMVLTVTVIGSLSVLSRLDNLSRVVPEQVQETREASMSAVIQEDQSGKYGKIAIGASVVLLLPVATVFLLKWIQQEGKKTKRSRTYFPTSEVTFKTISKKELGRKRVTRPRSSY